MNGLLKILLPALLLLALNAGVYAAPRQALWHAAPATHEELHGRPLLQPAAYRIFLTDEDSLRTRLHAAGVSYAGALLMDLPQPDGCLRRFRVWETPAMAAPLAARYSALKTFTAEAIDNPRVTAKLDYTPYGFHALVFDGGKTFLIDPCYRRPTGAYLCYFKSDYTRPSGARMTCANQEEMPLSSLEHAAGDARRLNGTVIKRYRLALAADSEYCEAVAGPNPTKTAVLSKMLTTLNRVNGVYERELSVTMELVANEDTLIFLADPDPYTNNSGSLMLGQNQATIDARIGTANYDIGHVFSTAGWGIATQGCVCNNLLKARGVTGSFSPAGDAFDIDFVAHEMGHQFGAGHTFNASTGACAGNGVRSISFEPGSGSTIMAYAGICGSGNDFQAHSDDYFLFASLDQMARYITAGGGSTCPQTSASPNSHYASLPPYAAQYVIPWQTPFELEAPQATDSEAERLSYCWEQADPGGIDFGESLANTHRDGPLFRSFPPDTSRLRVFPALARLVNGLSTPGEKLPDTGRSLHFRLTQRDIFAGWGNVNIADDIVTLQVQQTPGPFRVLSFSRRDTVTGGSVVRVEWDVAATTEVPIHCTSVDIFLSADGGYTFPYLLNAATPNDGSDVVIVPNITSTDSARIKVKAAGNVFFNINATNFRIEHQDTALPPRPPVLQAFRIWPIPAGQELYVRVPDSLGNVAFALFDVLGRAVMRSAAAGESRLDVGGLPRGVYYLRLYGLKLDAVRPVLLH